jgi:hypothetical protein
MTAKRKVVVIGLVLAPLGLLVVWYLNSPIRYLLTPPSDLYDALCLKPADFTKTGTSYECEYVNKYSGNHTIGVVVERPPDVTKDTAWTIKAKVVVSDGEAVLLSTELDKPYYPFWGGKFSRGGFALVGYRAPDNLPIGKVLKCKITLLKGDATFESTYGRTAIYVAKASDK